MDYSLGKTIRKYRLKNHMLQADLARAVGYKDASSIARIESDTADVPVKKLRLIANVLNANLAELLDIHPVEIYIDLTDYTQPQQEEIKRYAAYVKAFSKE